MSDSSATVNAPETSDNLETENISKNAVESCDQQNSILLGFQASGYLKLLNFYRPRTKYDGWVMFSQVSV